MFEKKIRTKDELIQVRVSTTQKEVVKKMANNLNLTQSELILNLLELQLKHKIIENHRDN